MYFTSKCTTLTRSPSACYSLGAPSTSVVRFLHAALSVMLHRAYSKRMGVLGVQAAATNCAI